MLERIVNLEKQLEESKAECLHLRQQLSSTENGMKPSEPEASVVNQQPTTDGDCDLRTLTKDSVVIARHMRQLNSVIGSLRAEKLALTTQLRKHQLRITHLENTVDRLSNEVGVTNSNRIPLEYEHVRLLTRSDAVWTLVLTLLVSRLAGFAFIALMLLTWWQEGHQTREDLIPGGFSRKICREPRRKPQ